MALSNALYQAGAQGVPPGYPLAPFNPTVNGPGQLRPAFQAAGQQTFANLPRFNAPVNPSAPNLGGAVPYARVLHGTPPGIGQAFPAPGSSGANAIGANMSGVPTTRSPLASPVGGAGRLQQLGTMARNPRAAWQLGRSAGAIRPGFATAATIGSAILTPRLEQAMPGDYGVGDQFIRGAGTLAPVGALFGPKGMAVAGFLGGGVNVVANAFGFDLFGGGGDDAEAADPHDQLNTWLGNVNISPEAARNIREEFEMNMMFAEEADDKDAARQQALASAQMSIQQYWATEQQQQEQARRAMAFQMAAQNYMTPHLTNMRETQNAYSNMLEGMAADLPPEMQPIARLTAGQGRAATDRMISAYANQVASMQQTNALSQYYADAQNMAAQQMSANIAQGVGGGGGGNISDIITQQMMAGTG